MEKGKQEYWEESIGDNVTFFPSVSSRLGDLVTFQFDSVKQKSFH